MKARCYVSVIIVVMLIAAGSTTARGETADSTRDDGVHALIIVPENYGLNYQLMREAIDQYGWNITLAGVKNEIQPCPPADVNIDLRPIIPHLTVSEIPDVRAYDCLIIAPATGSYFEIPDSHEDLIQSHEAMKLITDATDSGMPVFASCASVRVLAAADIIRGKKIVGSPRFREEYRLAGATWLGRDMPPTVDGCVITSMRGQTNSIANMIAVSSVMESRQSKSGEKNKPEDRFILSGPAAFEGTGITFARTYGGFASDGGHALLETSDGGFLITGYTYSAGTGDADVLVIKTDQNGETEWVQTYGSTGTEYGYGCSETGDSYLITGYTTSHDSRSKDIYLLNIDKQGGLVWENQFGGTSWDVGTSVCVTPDNNYLVCGFTHSYGAGEEDIYLLKIDSEGNEIWSQTYGGKRAEMGNTILPASDGGYVIGASTGTYGGINSDMYIIKIDADGTQIWDQSIDGGKQTGYGFDWCRSLSLTSSGGYILTGYSDCNWLMDTFIQTLDSLGQEVQRTIVGPGFYHFGNAAVETNDGRIAVCGSTRHISGNADITLIRIGADGALQGNENLIGAGNEYASDICLTRDGQLAVLGFTDSFGQGKFDVCLLKIEM